MRDWYGVDWKKLRSNVIRMAVECFSSSALSDQISREDSSVHAKRLHEILLARIGGLIRDDRQEMWRVVPALLANKERFADWMGRDQEAIAGRVTRNGTVVTPQQAFSKFLWHYLEAGRRDQIAAGMGVSAGRIKTWERLDRISRAVATDVGNRCNEEHFLKLSEHVRKHYAHDRNLPRKLGTIREYFYQFCATCMEGLPDDGNLTGATPEVDARDLFNVVGLDVLQDCIAGLSERSLSIVARYFDLSPLNMNPDRNRPQQGILVSEEGPDGPELERILAELRQCIEATLSAEVE